MSRPALRDLSWLMAGALLFGAVVVGFTLAYDDRPAAEQIAVQARKLELVGRMRAELASASDEAQGAVLAVTDEESQALAEAARASTAAVESDRQKLSDLLATDGRGTEPQLLQDFGQSLQAFRSLDEELLDLAVRNTNLKAYALLYGPAAGSLDTLREALDRLVPADGSAEAARILPLALGAEVAALRIHALLAPHVAEATDAGMDAMEDRMEELAEQVQGGLKGLRALPALASSDDLRAADEAWGRYRELKQQILALSRENTNVRSLAIALDRKRKLVAACAEALDALRQAIAAEPSPGAPWGPPPKPR